MLIVSTYRLPGHVKVSSSITFQYFRRAVIAYRSRWCANSPTIIVVASSPFHPKRTPNTFFDQTLAGDRIRLSAMVPSRASGTVAFRHTSTTVCAECLFCRKPLLSFNLLILLNWSFSMYNLSWFVRNKLINVN
ncbi:hypothetical protein EG68_11463 [Paragonimus skrjabini miyazakii]|uniref:Uncharacterized protein n=1 Tax=Paragonimus skrjabini miyazakii TaxID=59628 RepID=A0A8S9YA49_9TREM|nr:hypothetical protein EG68_11463 [Paragonimus skrjabini miyazakii]